MGVCKDILHEKRADPRDQVKPEFWTKLPDADMARLNDKREELIMILRFWHHYSRRQADRVISDWVSHHSQARPYRTELFLPKGKSQPFTRPSAS